MRAEGLGCPDNKMKIIFLCDLRNYFYVPRKTFFWSFTLISLLLFTTRGMPPLLSCMPSVINFFLISFDIFKHLPTLFFIENRVVGCPQTGCPEPSQPLGPPSAHHCITRL